MLDIHDELSAAASQGDVNVGIKRWFRDTVRTGNLGPRIHFSVTLLGVPLSGKTTLLNYWRGQPRPSLADRTHIKEVLEKYADFAVELPSGRRRITLDGLVDLSGAENALLDWESMIPNRHVIYLVDARSLCGCLEWTELIPALRASHSRSAKRVVRDAEHLRGIEQRNGPPRLFALLVTHVDEDCRRRRLLRHASPRPAERAYREQVEADVAKLREILGGAARVPLIIAPGDLRQPEVAHQVTLSLVNVLLTHGTPNSK